MTATYELETQPDIVCGECDRPLPPGSPIGEALEGMADDKPVVLTVCVYCAMGSCPRCRRCGGTTDLMDRGMAPGMAYCRFCREFLSVRDKLNALYGRHADSQETLLRVIEATFREIDAPNPRAKAPCRRAWADGYTQACEDIRVVAVGSATE